MCRRHQLRRWSSRLDHVARWAAPTQRSADHRAVRPGAGTVLTGPADQAPRTSETMLSALMTAPLLRFAWSTDLVTCRSLDCQLARGGAQTVAAGIPNRYSPTWRGAPSRNVFHEAGC